MLTPHFLWQAKASLDCKTKLYLRYPALAFVMALIILPALYVLDFYSDALLVPARPSRPSRTFKDG